MKELQNLEEVGGRTSLEVQGRGLWWSVRRDPDLVFCFRAVKSTCAAPRVTCWRRTGGEDVWTSTMSRTMQIVAAPQLPGEGGGKWPLGWVKKIRDWTALAAMARSPGMAFCPPEPVGSRKVHELLGFPLVCVHMILRYEALVNFLYRYQSSAL